jgi:hypothetical protein
MELAKLRFVGVDLIKAELPLAKRVNNHEHIESPSTRFTLDAVEWSQASKLLPNSSRGDWNSIQDDGNTRPLGDGIEQDVAADPLVTLRRRR